MTKFHSATSKTKRQINANDKSAIMTVSVAVVLLGAFFVINPINLTAFADVSPIMVTNTTGFDGPIHPGTFLTEKIVNFTNSTGDLLTITPAVNVTISVVKQGTDEPCKDLTGQVILNFTTFNTTTNIPEENYTKLLLYNETFVGMPGVYHCNVLFIAANVTTASDTTLIGNQTVWIDAIGSKGFWKNHPNATEQHLDGMLLGDFVVDNNVTATKIFKAHKGKFDLDKLAGQLLAAKLNIWALNMTEPFDKVDCIKGNVTGADLLLIEREYDGPEADNPKKKDKGGKAVAFAFHSALDDFNNNGCTLP